MPYKMPYNRHLFRKNTSRTRDRRILDRCCPSCQKTAQNEFFDFPKNGLAIQTKRVYICHVAICSSRKNGLKESNVKEGWMLTSRSTTDYRLRAIRAWLSDDFLSFPVCCEHGRLKSDEAVFSSAKRQQC